MTYRHKNFDQSEVLLEFEKIAQRMEHGFETPEPSSSFTMSVSEFNKQYDAQKQQAAQQWGGREIAAIEQAIEDLYNYVLVPAGTIPTPIGNPLAYPGIVLAIQKNDYENAFFFFASAIPYGKSLQAGAKALSETLSNPTIISALKIFIKLANAVKANRILNAIKEMFFSATWKSVITHFIISSIKLMKIYIISKSEEELKQAVSKSKEELAARLEINKKCWEAIDAERAGKQIADAGIKKLCFEMEGAKEQLRGAFPELNK
jgi:hypothetical protein